MHGEWQSGEGRHLSEGSMAQLRPAGDTGGTAAIGGGEQISKINLEAHHSPGMRR
jgi:hypothetical protein